MLIARLARLPAGRRLLLAEAAAELAVARAATAAPMSFARMTRWSARRLGRKSREDVAELVWAVRAVAGRAPFRAVCLQQGVALQRMLRRRGHDARLHYGLRTGGRLEAHAWVTLRGEVLIGGEEAVRFREVAAWP